MSTYQENLLQQFDLSNIRNDTIIHINGDGYKDFAICKDGNGNVVMLGDGFTIASKKANVSIYPENKVCRIEHMVIENKYNHVNNKWEYNINLNVSTINILKHYSSLINIDLKCILLNDSLIICVGDSRVMYPKFALGEHENNINKLTSICKDLENNAKNVLIGFILNNVESLTNVKDFIEGVTNEY